MKSLIFVLLISAVPLWAKDTAPLANGDLELAHRLENAFVKVASQASESVVVINTTQKHDVRGEGDEENNPFEQFKGTPFERFFRHYGIPFHVPGEKEPEEKGQGSGVIIRADGYILTNNHVVDGADDIHVRLKDGREFDGKLVGTDSRTDVAVIKIEGKDLPVARLGSSSQIKVGQWAIAIGAPFELDYSFTVGFVSAKERPALSHTSSVYDDFIQTDAAINPGNSGGPLCDIEGRVIGINTLIRGLNTGIGFAIPIDTAMDGAEKIIKDGRVARTWIGIAGQGLAENKELREMIPDVKDGVVVTRVEADTPAARAGLKPTDIVTSIDGVPVRTLKELQKQVLRKNVGQEVKLDVVRNGKPLKISLTTAEMTAQIQPATNRGGGKSKAGAAFGLGVQTLNKDLAKQFDVDESDGVVVTDVADGSIAEQQGLQRGDVITEVDHAPVRNAEEFKAAVAKADAKKGVLILIKRNGASTFVVLKEK